MMLLAPLDRGIARATSVYLRTLASHPLQAMGRAHLQSVMIIQPADVLPDGRTDMCDGCPDMTVWNGELAWSCRLEEPMTYGQFVDIVPRKHEPAH